ncbi:WXG100 family type VII secretion target [Mycobacterium sp. NBC_00419]|uniref:WXG100 family type VII secretion target n=1 Tax=Mycobacterium sp. NBC_00419 TaxID=2975989 RepID=UPI002E20DA42
MSESLHVDPEALVASGAQVDQHSQNVFATHSAADERVGSSLFSWTGQSQAAMTAVAAKWATVTDALAVRLYEHGEALRVGGMTFAQMDSHDRDTLMSVYRPGSGHDA